MAETERIRHYIANKYCGAVLMSIPSGENNGLPPVFRVSYAVVRVMLHWVN